MMPLPAPSQAQPPQGFSGPASAPSGNPGLEADALAKVRGAAAILEQALPNLPFGSEPHKTVLDAIKGLSKIAPASSMPHGVQTSMLQGLQQNVQQNAMLQQLMRFQQAQKAAGGGAMPPQGGPPQAGGGMPPTQGM